MSMLLASGFGSIALTSTVPVVGVVEKPAFPPMRGAGFWYTSGSEPYDIAQGGAGRDLSGSS
jgi:hypothetical protein